MYLLGLHGFKQIVDTPGFRYIGSLPDQLGDTLYRKFFAVENRHLAHGVFQMEDPYVRAARVLPTALPTNSTADAARRRTVFLGNDFLFFFIFSSLLPSSHLQMK